MIIVFLILLVEITMLADRLRFNLLLAVATGHYFPQELFSPPRRSLYYLYMVLCETTSLISCITIFANMISPDVSLSNRCYSGFTGLVTAQVMLNSVSCHVYSRKIVNYFSLWDQLVESDADKALKDALDRNTSAIKRLSIWLLIFMVGPMFPWGALPLFIKIISYWVPSLEYSYQFIAVPAQYPFDPLVSPSFELITIFQGFAAFVVNAKIIAYNTLMYGLISSEIVTFKILKRSMNNILERNGSRFESYYCGKTQNDCLKHWVQKHSKLLYLSDLLNQLYSPMLLLQFGVNTLVLCSNAFVVAAASVTKMELLLSAGYIIATLTHLYILCWLGDELTSHSGSVAREAFWQPWILCSNDAKLSLKIIFERTKVPVIISAFGTFNLSVETFKSIGRTAFSYFMVLNQIKSK